MIRVIVVEESPLQCDLVGNALNDAFDIDVIARTTNIVEAVRRASEASAIVAAYDLPDRGAESLLDSIDRKDGSPVVVFTRVPAAPSVVVDAYESGAGAVVREGESMTELLTHLRAAVAREALMSPEVGGRLIERVAALAELCKENEIDISRASSLTPREWEVLELLDRGSTNAEVAERLGIEVGTAKNHVHNIIQKLGVSDRGEAALYHRLISHRAKPDETGERRDAPGVADAGPPA